MLLFLLLLEGFIWLMWNFKSFFGGHHSGVESYWMIKPYSSYSPSHLQPLSNTWQGYITPEKCSWLLLQSSKHSVKVSPLPSTPSFKYTAVMWILSRSHLIKRRNDRRSCCHLCVSKNHQLHTKESFMCHGDFAEFNQCAVSSPAQHSVNQGLFSQ